MNKYTINKTFERNFPFPIWKIEVDTTHAQIAIECRNPESTLPIFSVFSFEGLDKLEYYEVDNKEWTLEDIQGDFLILKRFGDFSPVQAGIQVIHIPSGISVFTYMEYVIKEIWKDTIVAYHRSIPSGLLFYIDIQTGEITNKYEGNQEFPFRDIHYPIPYQGKLPAFLDYLSFVDQIWLQPYCDLYLWSYHTQNTNSYNLNLSLSSKNELFDSKIIIEDLEKLIPQPYFTVKGYIFFLSSNKMKISSYLV